MQSIRRKQRCQQNCKQHIFKIKNLNGSDKYDTEITYCPKFRRDPYPPEKTIPQFNFDKKHFTSAFVLGTDKKSLNANSHQQLVHFNSQIRQSLEKNNQIFFPKPNEKNSYCSVCKQHYINYYQHIRCEEHLNKIDAAIYNVEIKRLCEEFRDYWDGAHQKADNQMKSQYLRLQRQLESSSVNNEQSSYTNRKKIQVVGSQSSEQQQSQQDSNELVQEIIKPYQSAPKSQSIKNQPKNRQIAQTKMIDQKCQTKESKKKKKQEQQELYENQYIKTNILNRLPKQQIKTRSAINPSHLNKTHKTSSSQKDNKLQTKIPIKNNTEKLVRNKDSLVIQRDIGSFPENNLGSSQIPMPIPDKAKQNELVVLLKRNKNGRYQVVRSKQKSANLMQKNSQQGNLSLQVKIRKDTKQIIKPKNKSRQQSDDQYDGGNMNICNILTDKFKKNHIRKPIQPYNNQRPSSTPQQAHPQISSRQIHPNMNYPYYYGNYRQPPQQGRLPVYPYPPPNFSTPPNNKQVSSIQGQPSKAPYYPYQFQYQNSWYSSPYMMPQVMKDREKQTNKSSIGNGHPPTSIHNYQKPSVYPQPYAYNYQGGNPPYLPFMANQQTSYNQHNKNTQQLQPPNVTGSGQAQNQFWYPPYMYNMPINNSNNSSSNNAAGNFPISNPAKYMPYQYMKPGHTSNSEDQSQNPTTKNFERK